MTIECLRPRLILCTLAVSVIGLCVLCGGCPAAAVDTNGNTTDPNNSGTNTNTGDPNSTGTNTNSGDPNSTGTTDGSGTGTDGTGTGIENIDGSTGNGTTNGSNTGNGTTGNGTNTNGGNSTGTTTPTAIALQQIVQTGDHAPGQLDTVTFTQFGNPVIDANGRVAFWALYSGTGAKGYGGLYVWDAGQMKRVLDDDPATAGIVPGRTTKEYFGRYGGQYGTSPLASDVAWAAGDRLMFVSEVTGQQDSAGMYRWRATDANLVRIADREQVAALFTDASPATLAPSFKLPGVSDGGIAIFGLSYAYFTQPPGAQYFSGQGVFTSNGTTVSVLADTRHSVQAPGDVPGQDATAFFKTIDTLTTINSAGDMLFQGRYSSGTGSLGVYLGRADAEYRVIDNRTGATWPGLTAGAQLTVPSGAWPTLAMGSAGHIAVDGQLKVGSDTHDTVLLWNFGTSTWTELTGANGAPATSLATGVNDDGQTVIVSGGVPYLMTSTTRMQLNATMPAQLAGVTVTWTPGGGSINNDGRTAIGYSREGGSAGLVFWTGAQLLLVTDVGAGVPAGISQVYTITDPRRDRPGRSGFLNDKNEVTFRVGRSAGGEALYVAQAQ